MSTQVEAVGLVGSLLDFSFSEFVTAKLIRVLYGLGLISAGFTAFGVLGAGLAGGFLQGVVALFLAPLVFLVMALYIRVLLEVLMVVFRSAEDVAKIAERASSSGS